MNKYEQERLSYLANVEMHRNLTDSELQELQDIDNNNYE